MADHPPSSSSSKTLFDLRPTRSARLRRMCAGRRVRPVWVLLVALPLMFGLQRGLLAWLSRADLIGEGAAAVARAMLVGLRYDLRATAYALIPLWPLLVLAPERAFDRRPLRAIISTYVGAVVALAMGVCIVDGFFFLVRDARVNNQVPNYMAEAEIIRYIWDRYPVLWAAAAILMILAAVEWLTRRLCLGGGAAAEGFSFWPRAAYGAVLAGGIYLAASGPADRPALDSSMAYSSSHRAISELSLNPAVTLASAVRDYYTEAADEPLHFPLLAPEEALAASRGALAQHHTRLQEDSLNPLTRIVETGRPERDLNVVLVVMESFAGPRVGALGGGGASLTPFFDRLAGEGLYLSQMFAAGQRTAEGLLALLCGFPEVLGGRRVLERPQAEGRFTSLFDVFRARGYRTLMLYGGNGDFDNMKRFFGTAGAAGAVGLERFLDLDDMPADAWRTHWGVADHVVFEAADREFRRIDAAGGRFFAVILTLTNHNPHAVPPGCVEPAAQSDAPPEAREDTALRYADWAMERFFRAARASDYFDRTLFVLVADHGVKFNRRYLVDVDGFRVPCLLYAPAIAECRPREIPTPCSQVDVPATVLSLLGGRYVHGTFGRDLLDPAATLPGSDDGLALLRADRRMALVRGEWAIVLSPDSEPVLFRRDGARLVQSPPGAAAERVAGMRRTAMGLYQTAREVYQRCVGGSSAVAGRDTLKR